jgi:hypothetical protein
MSPATRRVYELRRINRPSSCAQAARAHRSSMEALFAIAMARVTAVTLRARSDILALFALVKLDRQDS